MASRIGKKPAASLNPNRLNARSSWTVSKNPSRYAAREAKFSRQSSGLAQVSAARKSPRKSRAFGSQLIIGQRGAVVCIGTTGSVVMNYGDDPTVVLHFVRQDTIVFWIPLTEKKHGTSVLRSVDPSAIRRMSEALPESRVLPNSYQDLLQWPLHCPFLFLL